MFKNSNTLLIALTGSALLLSIFFGLTSLVTESSGRGLLTEYTHYTDWGRVALCAVFGLGGVAALVHLLSRRK